MTGPGRADIWAVEGPEFIAGVPAERYSQVDVPINTVWMRDYGPFGLSAKQARVGIVDSIYRHYQYRRSDDALPSNLGKAMKIDVFGMQVIIDGGNVMTDSKGSLFMTKRTYIWNPDLTQDQVDSAIKTYFNVKNIYTFEYAGYPGWPQDGTGHIDMFMKLLNDHTVLVSVADTEPFQSNAEKAMAFFRGRTAPDGAPYDIITVRGWESSGTWYTYTNSLIVNRAVLMPSYSGHAGENALAEAAYEAGIPGVSVVPILSDSSIRAGGSVHCVTQTIPALPGRSSSVKDVLFENIPAGGWSASGGTPPPTPAVPENANSTALDQLKEQAAPRK